MKPTKLREREYSDSHPLSVVLSPLLPAARHRSPEESGAEKRFYERIFEARNAFFEIDASPV